MKLKTIFFISCFFMQLFSHAQNFDYSVFTIPDSLTVGANAVIRSCKQEIDIHNEKSMTITFSKVITVLNKEGDKHIDVYKHYSNDSKIKKIEAVLYNSMGQEVLKYKKKDFRDVSAAQGFYSDDRVKYLNFTPRGYPYTLKFEYVYTTKTTAFIPSWFPLEDYYLSVQKKELIVYNDKKVRVNVKENQLSKFDIENLSGTNTIHYKVANKTAVKKEKYSPNFEDFFPNVKLYLNKFALKGYESDEIKNWKDFGFWLRKNIYDSQLELTEETEQKIKELTKNEDNPLKKAKLVYEYMQSKTRYVYVGIGVGGWQPTKALDVDRLGYGDCKGLSNYTKAMLDVIGIPSNWVLVSSNQKRDFDKDFHGIQGNHMILNLPKLNNGKDVWLECTSQTIPFGFLGDFTDDRDVLVLEKEGGVIKHTPKYLDENNQQITTGVISINNEGDIQANLNMEFTGLQYGDQYRKETFTSKELEKYYKSNRWSYIDNLKVQKHHFIDEKEKLSFTEKLEISIENYANVLGDEIIFRLNVFTKSNFKPSVKKKRENDICVRNGYLDTDEINVKIPEGYIYEQDDIIKNIETEFGNYSMSITKKSDNELIYKRKFLLKEGGYDREKYEAFSDFVKQVNKNDQLKIIFSKK